MAEYYAVLSRAVASLEVNTPEARRAVYDKARNALIGQLKAIVPPLPTSEISRQRLELEEAIRRAEREASNAAAGQPARTAKRPNPSPPPEPAPSPAPVYEAAEVEPADEEDVASTSPQDVFRRAIREAESRATITPPPLERAPAQARGAPTYSDTEPEFHVDDRPRRAPNRGEPAPYIPPTDYRRSDPEPRLAPDYGWDSDGPEAGPTSRFAGGPYIDGNDRAANIRSGRRRSRRDIDGDADFEDGDARPSRLPTILLLVLIVAMIGGLAALAWSQRAEISKILTAFDNTSGTTSPTAAAPPPPTDNASAPGKNGDRLLGGNGVATTPGVRVVGEGDNSGAAATNAPAQPQPSADTGGALVAQKAVLYEEPLDAAKAANGVVQVNAAVTWSYDPSGANGPAVIANLDVPERGLQIKMTFHKNTDKTLPASHLIEVVTHASADFPGKGISNIPRLVLKPAEDARGQPLIAASAKVSDGYFWIALSALDADVQSNLALLKDREWIDLPLVYQTGQRAILTFEKGTTGDRAFASALAAWSG